MKHLPFYIIVVVFSFCFAQQNLWAQQGNERTDVAQELSSVKFDKSSWDFGDIKENGGEVTHIFTFINTSSRPVVVLDVSASCGCTSPSFSRKPVMPQSKGEITISFDPMNRPGRFSKGVVVKLSSNERAVLTVEGNVLPRERTMEELYPFEVGEGVRLDSNFHAFSYIGRGEHVQATVVVYNTSDKDASIKLRPTKQSGLLHIQSPTKVKAQGMEKIVLTYDIAADSKRYGMLDDIFSVEVNGKESRTLISTHAIAVDKYDAAIDDMEAPSYELSKNFIKFGEIKFGSRVENDEVEIVNDGESELIIRAVEWKSDLLECSLKAGDRLKAGERRRIKLALNSKGCDYGVWTDRVTLITNSPERPMVSIRVTAIVEQ